MDAFQQGTLHSSGLTQLYTDIKQSYRSAAPSNAAEESADVKSLHREYSIQKDRLHAWGVDWSDGGSASAQGSIDASVERAGLTDVVSSIMENIRNVRDEAENLRRRTFPLSPPPGQRSEKASPRPTEYRPWSARDISRYADVVRDMTGAIDLLCEFSNARNADDATKDDGDATTNSRRPDPGNQEYSDFALNQSNTHVTLGQTDGEVFAPPKIHMSSLILPDEGPPPYDNLEISCPVRMLGYFRSTNHSLRTRDNDGSQSPTVPVLIEYASLDTLPIEIFRLKQLFRVLRLVGNGIHKAVTKLIGYFEDPHQPRIGLVYDVSQFTDNIMPASSKQRSPTRCTTLSHLLQIAAKAHANPTASAVLTVPFLEQRFRLAYELISSFSMFTEHSFTHRDLNSNSIVFFPKYPLTPTTKTTEEFQYDVRKPLIGSFDLFSENNDCSPELLHQNMYRHPSHPRIKDPDRRSSQSSYCPEYDLYSLGLVLLEIGLWSPLAAMYKEEKYTLNDFRIRIEKIYTKRLASKCGSAYMRAVQDCLLAGKQMPQSQECLIETYARVKSRLQRCCALDEEEVDEPIAINEQVQDIPFESTPSKMTSIPHPSARQQLYQDQFPADHYHHVQDVNIPQVPEVHGAQPTPIEQTTHRDSSFPPMATVQRPPSMENGNETRTPRKYRFPDKQLPAYLDAQYYELCQRLARIACKALRHRPGESMEVGVGYIGESEESAKPTLEVACTSTKLVRAAVKRHFRYDPQVWDVLVVPGSCHRSHAAPASKRLVRRSRASCPDNKPVQNPYHHARPLCGASIGAWKDERHLPPVSFGGVIMIDGEPYGMSVHHLMEDPGDEEDDNENSRSAAPLHLQPESDLSPSEQVFSDFEDVQQPCDLFSSLGSHLADPHLQVWEEDENETSDYDSIFAEDDQSDVDDVDSVSDGDLPGVAPGQLGDDVVVTQPALNDVDKEFFPVEEDSDEDHILSHSLGHIYASSGIRRLQRDGVVHEVDWSLLKLKDERLQPYNVVAGGKRYCRSASTPTPPKLLQPICRPGGYEPNEDLYPRRILNSDSLPGLDVHCFGRTSGLASGRVGKQMRFVKFPGRLTPAQCWLVHGDFGHGGDSGAWVIENEGGRLCGHVLGWSSTLNGAYISPMDMMFEDIRETLGARRVYLPGAFDDKACARVRPESGELELDFARLGLEDDASPARANLLAHHFLLSGAPDHLEREWAARRSNLGLTDWERNSMARGSMVSST